MTAGKLMTSSPSEKSSKPSKGVKAGSNVDLKFAAEWNALDKPTRRQIRRLVRIGRPQENAHDARMAVGFSAYQRSRGWFRFFWLWFTPLMVAGVIAGFAVHPIIIGMVLAAAGNAYLVRRAFNKTDWLNEPLLEGGSSN
ncbi:MAG: hypothetical protein LW869_06150 [Actinobacteria bacterium]|nr:hypothetical protein [Actinomycetota bacterium]